MDFIKSHKELEEVLDKKYTDYNIMLRDKLSSNKPQEGSIKLGDGRTVKFSIIKPKYGDKDLKLKYKVDVIDSIQNYNFYSPSAQIGLYNPNYQSRNKSFTFDNPLKGKEAFLSILKSLEKDPEKGVKAMLEFEKLGWLKQGGKITDSQIDNFLKQYKV